VWEGVFGGTGRGELLCRPAALLKQVGSGLFSNRWGRGFHGIEASSCPGRGGVRRDGLAWAGKSTPLRLESLEARWLLSDIPFTEIDLTNGVAGAYSV
jgi:hypothetical protein